MPTVQADFYLKKVYCCPCLTYLVQQIHNADIRKWKTIK